MAATVSIVALLYLREKVRMVIGIDQVFDFTRLLLRFQAVIRQVNVPDRVGKENDVEHSYHLAMMAWYLNATGKLGLASERLMMYALVHDMAEAYAGDVHVLDHAARVGKAEREEAALIRIAAEIPEFPELVAAVGEYELQDDDESRFIYALDKLMPMIMIYLEGGSTWHELDFSMQELLDNKNITTAAVPLVHNLSNQLEALIRSNTGLFPRP